MKIHVKIVAMLSTAAVLGGCLTGRFDEPPVAAPEAQASSSDAVVPAAPTLAVSAAPAPAVPAREPALILVAESRVVPAEGLLITGLQVERDSISILASGQIRDYKLLTLSDPSRLVIDIPDAVSGFERKNIPIDKLGISAARFESHPGHLRIFLDATQWRIIPYRIEEAGASLKIVITTP